MQSLTSIKEKVFYGWWIVGAVFLILAYFSGVIFYGFTAIFEPIANEFGWSYAQVSFAASIRGMEVGLLVPLVGFLFDRWGPRRLVFAGIISTGLGLLLMGRVNSLIMFYGTFIIISIGTSTCGASMAMMVVGNWFRRRVSTATGIAISGISIGGLLVVLITHLVNIFEWRAAVMILGLSAWAILLPLTLLLRHKPEQYGYLPDGDVNTKPLSSEGLNSIQSTEVDIGVKQALKSRAFWHITMALAFHLFVIMAVITHVMPYLSTVGIARLTSSLVASAIPVTSILGRLSFGWFGDRYNKRRVTAAGFALVSLSMLLFNYVATVEGTWLLVLFVIFFGIGSGGPTPMVSALLRDYFGRAKLGTLIGLSMGISMLGSIAGPPLAGWVFDSFGSYQGAWFAFAGISIAAMVGLLTTPSVGSKMRMADRPREQENTS